MPTNRFADRLDPVTFADDPVVGVYEGGPDDGDALWISERLFGRFTLVASAYELHALPLLGGTDPVPLNRATYESLLDEIAFVAERLDDPLVTQVAQTLSDYLASRTQNPVWGGVITVEGE